MTLDYGPAHAAFYDELMACHDEMVATLLKKLEKSDDIENVITEEERLENLWQKRLETLKRNVRPDLMHEYSDFYCNHFMDKIKEAQELLKEAKGMRSNIQNN